MESQGAVPSQMRYNQMLPSSARARTLRNIILPVNNSTITLSGNATSYFRFQVGAAPSLYVDPRSSYLELEVSNASISNDSSGSNMITYLDGNSYSFVDRAEIYVGSNLLYNSGNNLHQCYGVNRDFQEDPSTSRASDSILAGSLNVNYATDVLSTYSAQATVRAGAIMGSSGSTLANRRVFSVPLLDPCLGTGNTKFFPLASMLNNTMTYDFYLTSPNNVLHTIDASGTLNYTGSYQVKARLVLLCYELDSQASNMVRQVGAGSDGITRINTNSWKTSLFSIAAGSTSVSIQVPFKVSSLKNLIFVMKNSSENNNARAQYISQRSKAFLQSYQLYASNGQLIPSTPVSLTADVNEAFNETALCFYSSTNITQVPSLISWSSFSNDAHPTSRRNLVTDDAAFLGGLSLENFNNSNLLGGFNSASNNLILNLTFSQATQATIDLILIACHDSVLEFMPTGQISMII
jgi:hypothetical protein